MRVWLRRHPGLLSEAETLELYESWHMSQRQEAAARKTQGQPMPQTVKVPQPPAGVPAPSAPGCFNPLQCRCSPALSTVLPCFLCRHATCQEVVYSLG